MSCEERGGGVCVSVGGGGDVAEGDYMPACMQKPQERRALCVWLMWDGALCMSSIL